MLLVLRRSPEQEVALSRLLDEQQEKSSANFHRWLTPEEYGARFGPTDSDIQTVVAWLQSHGFQINGVSQGRTVIEFSGTAGQIQSAFQTAIHKYVINGEEHWANSSDPQIPAALTPVVAGVDSLHNFRRKAMNVRANRIGRFGSPLPGITPDITVPFCDPNCFDVGPYDFATIYNILPLWQGGIDGTGQTIAIVGRTNINIQDTRDFRTLFGLPAKDPQIILNGPDPGINDDEGEANIDVQWSGAVARNATIKFVTSESTEATDGVDLSAIYIVDRNLAPVMSESYGICELGAGTAGNQFFNALWQQAAAQGISVFISTGDNSAAGCDGGSGPAGFGLAVSGIASTPYNVAVGGTDFGDFANPTLYWNTTNDPTTQASAKKYIPETTWNDNCTNPLLASVGFSTNAETNCNDSQLVQAGFVNTIGGSGGASNCTVNGQAPGTCSGGYAKPAWQSGAGVPSDGKRDIPDVSLFASNGFVRHAYAVCQSSLGGPSCNLGTYIPYGGTSVASPAFAGIMALVNQQTGSRQGNANYIFYKLAAKIGASGCNSTTGPSTSCIFNDVTKGTIATPCLKGSPNCTVAVSSHSTGVLSGYSTTSAFDLATGLGTVNVQNLVNQWNSVTLKGSVTTLNSLTPATVTHGQPVSVNLNVGAAPPGTGTPTGSVALIGGPAGSQLSIDTHALTSGAATWSTSLLPGGSYNVTAHYSGDGIFGSSDSGPLSITVNKEASLTNLQFVTFNSSGVPNYSATSAVYGSPYILRIDVTNAAGSSCEPNPTRTIACATGNLNLTDNGSPLDGGAFVLNSLGYTEDQLVQLSGGTHALQAQYAGDTSFNTSTGTRTVTITKATTTMSALTTVSQGTVGVSFPTQVTVFTNSNGSAPSGTVSFTANGSPLSGTVNYFPEDATATVPASLVAMINGVISAPGTYSIVATYNGDTNYSTSNSTAASVSVKYKSPTVTMTPSTQTINPGDTATLVATVTSTGAVGGTAPSGTVDFTNAASGQSVGGTTTYTTFNDGGGNPTLQATFKFTPNANVSVNASYKGDSNYLGALNFGTGSVVVNGTDYSLSADRPSVTVFHGSQVSLNITISGQSNYNSALTFSPTMCSGLPAESSCSFSPPSVTGPGSMTLTVSTTAPHQVASNTNYSVPFWTGMSGFLCCIVLFGFPNSKRRMAIGVTVLTLAFASLLVGCGGGGGGGGGHTDPGTPAGSYTITVAADSTHKTSFTLVVQ
jgi:Pro-kumamolisin, activation domain/Bacterial Ig-like domain (group 3)